MIFIGASGVQYWNAEGQAAWEKYYAPRNAFNFGVAGDKTQDVLWRLSHTNLKFLKPKIAVIFVGLNNYTNTPRDIASGVEAVAKKVRDIFPEIKILLVSLTPNLRGNLTIARANELLRNYADNKKLFYIDLYSRMTPEGTTWKGLRSDQLHLTPEGYETWAELMEPTVQQILQAGSVSLPGRKPTIWTFVFLHSSEETAAQTEAILLRSISPGISLRVDGRITGILASNEEAIQSEGFSARSIRAFARQLNLSATRVSAPKHKTALHLLHREGVSLLELPNK